MRVDELSSLVRLRRRTEEDSLSRPIMRLVPVLIPDELCILSIKTAIDEKVTLKN